MKRIAFAIFTSIGLVASAQTQPSVDTVPVTADNFTRAETDSYFGDIVKNADGVGKFFHRREIEPVDNQIVIRGNRDTVYSAAVFDLDAGPVTVTLPLALQLLFLRTSESMGNHDSEIVDAGSVD
jgi:hypothetical protein